MATDTDIPITVADDAVEFIDKVGMRPQFETMLEHIKKTAPGLRAIEVTLEHDPCGDLPLQVVIWPHRDVPKERDDPTNRGWSRWKVETFPPEVCLNFLIISVYGVPADGW
jgi:hypothetical protein